MESTALEKAGLRPKVVAPKGDDGAATTVGDLMGRGKALGGKHLYKYFYTCFLYDFYMHLLMFCLFKKMTIT